MKIQILFLWFLLAFIGISSEAVSNVVHIHAREPWREGFWRKKIIWKPRWVKTWQTRKVYVAVWKRVWGPIELKEYVPLPKPPPGWIHHHK
uniref:Uncharacterized protein n=1 Tax=Phlebotomus papatasi TaxID=29031 RepID=A0A1B0CYN7_PHLPP